MIIYRDTFLSSFEFKIFIRHNFILLYDFFKIKIIYFFNIECGFYRFWMHNLTILIFNWRVRTNPYLTIFDALLFI